MKKWIVVSIVVLVAVGLYVNSNRSQAIKVTAVEVQRGDVVASVTNTRAGTVDACRRAGIAPTIGGSITALYVDDGDRVEAGQLLLELWNDDLKAHLLVAERDAEAARSLSRQACVTADVAKRAADRLVRLRQDNVASQDAVERAVGEAQSSAAACDASKAVATVKVAAIGAAQAALQRTQLRAPFEGVIAEINGELGEFVTPSPVGIPTPPTVDLIDTSCLLIKAPIDEVDAPAVVAGQRAWISLDAFRERRFSGKVQRVAPYVQDREKQSRTVDVEAVIDDPEAALLLPGYSADVEVIIDTSENVLYLPTAVILDDAGIYLIPAGGGTITLRNIETGLSNWERTEIVSGLREGDIVVRSVDRAGVADGVLAEIE